MIRIFMKILINKKLLSKYESIRQKLAANEI